MSLIFKYLIYIFFSPNSCRVSLIKALNMDRLKIESNVFCFIPRTSDQDLPTA